ncbi:hypothetical protein DKB58_03385 [Capnocytophaga canimorsus]|nr:hypothetical protein DKB58_03385 [Capnocytophaga canimorsus]
MIYIRFLELDYKADKDNEYLMGLFPKDVVNCFTLLVFIFFSMVFSECYRNSILRNFVISYNNYVSVKAKGFVVNCFTSLVFFQWYSVSAIAIQFSVTL